MNNTMFFMISRRSLKMVLFFFTGEWRLGGRKDAFRGRGGHQSGRERDPSAGGGPPNRGVLQAVRRDPLLGPPQR